MKKFIIIELLLFFGLCNCLYTDYLYFISFLSVGLYYNTIALLNILATITQIIAMILIALFNIPAFKPLLDKLSARRSARRSARAEQKAERAEAAKQERIAKLESELNELKKDDIY